MPYSRNDDLPPVIRDRMPPHAQDIFREAFNHAWEEYADPAQRSRGGSREEVANRVAWAAVKRKYRKAEDEWVPKEINPGGKP